MPRHTKLVRLTCLALRNALVLHADSILLFRASSYGSAVSLSVLAAEELGKCFLMDEIYWRADSEWSERGAQEDFMTLAFRHSAKQNVFARDSQRALAKPVVARIWKGALEERKQRGFYVGVPRRKNGKPDLQGKILSPHQIGRGAARRQISMVNDALVALAVGSACGAFELDVPQASDMLTTRLARRLLAHWPRLGRGARAYIRLVNPRFQAGQ